MASAVRCRRKRGLRSDDLGSTLFSKYNKKRAARDLCQSASIEETPGDRAHAMNRIRALLRHIAAFHSTACVVCLVSGTLTGIILSITAFAQFGGTATGYSSVLVYLMMALATLNTIATVLFVQNVIRRRRAVAEGTQRPKSYVLAEMFASNEMQKSTLTLILSFGLLFVMMFCNQHFLGDYRISNVWLIVTLVPAGLSCLNSLLINIRVSTGEFGFNSLEGMEIIQLIKKRGLKPPEGGGPSIFRDFQKTQELERMRELKDASII
jgi:uncharacterized membrane protein